MAVTVTPVYDNLRDLRPILVGEVPAIIYTGEHAIVSSSFMAKLAKKFSSPCVGAGKGCSCGCEGCPSNETRNQMTIRKTCQCSRNWIVIRNVNTAEPSSHECECEVSSSRPMTKTEIVAYASMADARGNVTIAR